MEYGDILTSAPGTAGQVLTSNGAGSPATMQNASGPSADATVKAWINFNQVGAITINDSFNVASITDTGTGTSTVYWDTDFANGNYSIASMAGNYASFIFGANTANWTTTHVNITNVDNSGSNQDAAINSLIAIGDQ